MYWAKDFPVAHFLVVFFPAALLGFLAFLAFLARVVFFATLARRFLTLFLGAEPSPVKLAISLSIESICLSSFCVEIVIWPESSP